MDLSGLFFSAFLAATLLPGGSEIVLAYLDHHTSHGFWTLLLVASVGNTLGALVSFGLGRALPARDTWRPDVASAITRVRRYGAPVLLLSWVPLVGDVLCVAAGWLRVPWVAAALFIGAGKTVRYAVVMVVF